MWEKEAQKRYRLKLISQGLCNRCCGKNPINFSRSKVACTDCLEQMKKDRAKIVARRKNDPTFRERERKYRRTEHLKRKELIFNHYGNICVCCGETEPMFLTIDHIEGNGSKHRKQLNRAFYGWLVKNNFPEGYQTLCSNCNHGRYRNGGICPHQIKLLDLLQNPTTMKVLQHL